MSSKKINFDFSKEESMASVVYNYKHGFSGFAAMLTPEQAKQIAGQHYNREAMHASSNVKLFVFPCIDV